MPEIRHSPRSWSTVETCEDWKKANVISVFKNGKTVDPGN